jgi:hypothetical protein
VIEQRMKRTPSQIKESHGTDDAPASPAALPREVEARWDALADAAKQVASATDDAEGFHAALNAMRQVGRGIDEQQILNAMHVPKDAGEHSEALRGMLDRIPDGWGRWISCDRGWYPLLVELDQQLRELLPNYELHQVKEKYGDLRYYWESGEEIHDPDDTEPALPPGPGRSATELARWERAHEAWYERLDVYRQTPEGQQRIADLERRVGRAEHLVASAEGRASVTCEVCGAAGELHRTPGSAPWYKTLCPACAGQAGYKPNRESDAR